MKIRRKTSVAMVWVGPGVSLGMPVRALVTWEFLQHNQQVWEINKTFSRKMRNLDTNYCWRKWKKKLSGLHGECSEAEYFWKPRLLLRHFGKSCCPSHLAGWESFLCAGNVDMCGFWLFLGVVFGFLVFSCSWGIYMDSSYPMFKEEKSTKVKSHPGAKTLLLDLADVWLQSRWSDFQFGLLGKKAALGTKQRAGLLAVSPTG